MSCIVAMTYTERSRDLYYIGHVFAHCCELFSDLHEKEFIKVSDLYLNTQFVTLTRYKSLQ